MQQRLKLMVKGLLARCGLRLVKLDAGIGYDTRHGVNLLPAFVAKHAAESGRRLRVVQIGAYDGVSEDPVWEMVDANLIDAVLVEPVPELCNRLRELHKERANVQVLQVAISPREGTLPFFVPVREDGSMIVCSIPSLDRRFVEGIVSHSLKVQNGMFEPGTRVEQIDVECLTVPTLLERVGWDEADVFVIDVEGMDAELVDHLLASGYRPKLILFEVTHVTLRNFGNFLSGLERAGYLVARSGLDMLAVLDDAKPAAGAWADG